MRKFIIVIGQIFLAAISLAFILFIAAELVNGSQKEKFEQQLIEIKKGNLEISRLQEKQTKIIFEVKKDSSLLDSLNFLSGLIAYRNDQNHQLLEGLEQNLNGNPLFKNTAFMTNAIKGILNIIISFPFIILLVVMGIITNTIPLGTFNSLIRNFKTVEALGAKVELTDKNKADLEETIRDYRSVVKFQFDIWQQRHDIRGIFEKVTNKLKIEINSKFGLQPDDVRFTLHVPDLLFKNQLYQLIDYWPRGDGRGRTFSTRFGIIGRTWRLEEDLLTNVPADPKTLMENWSMTREEAANKDKLAFGSIVLKTDRGATVGVLYMDSKTTNMFGTDTQLTTKEGFCTFAKTECKANGLITALEDIKKELMNNYLLLDF